MTSNYKTILQWVGGKSRQLPDLLPLIPYWERYVEPYGGAASVLIARNPSPVEVYNDMSADLVNLFRVVRHPDECQLFLDMLEWTPYSRSEFASAIALLQARDTDPVVRAWAFFVRQNQVIGGIASERVAPSYWSRSISDNGCVGAWREKIRRVREVASRFFDVQIENRDALQVIKDWDSPETVFYLDPPYVLDTRGDDSYYEFEMGDQEHAALVTLLLDVAGAVVLSGYETPIYQPLLDAGWTVDRYGATTATGIATGTDRSFRRIEVVWRNESAVMCAQQRLFG